MQSRDYHLFRLLFKRAMEEPVTLNLETKRMAMAYRQNVYSVIRPVKNGQVEDFEFFDMIQAIEMVLGEVPGELIIRRKELSNARQATLAALGLSLKDYETIDLPDEIKQMTHPGENNA